MFVYRPAYVFHRRWDTKPSFASSLIFFSKSQPGYVAGPLAFTPLFFSAEFLSVELGVERAKLRTENHLPRKIEFWGRNTHPLPLPAKEGLPVEPRQWRNFYPHLTQPGTPPNSDSHAS